jgi:hypothetical protein
MESLDQGVWYTGDWKSGGNNPNVPYNGLKIIATANYGNQTSPSIPAKLTSAELNVVDYTFDSNGVSSTVTIYKMGTPYDIPIPENTAISPPQPNLQFTVAGVGSDTLGKVKLDVNPGGTYLSIQFSYGLTGRKRGEIGYIMKFAETKQPEQDSIEAEG